MGPWVREMQQNHSVKDCSNVHFIPKHSLQTEFLTTQYPSPWHIVGTLVFPHFPHGNFYEEESPCDDQHSFYCSCIFAHYYLLFNSIYSTRLLYASTELVDICVMRRLLPSLFVRISYFKNYSAQRSQCIAIFYTFGKRVIATQARVRAIYSSHFLCLQLGPLVLLCRHFSLPSFLHCHFWGHCEQ